MLTKQLATHPAAIERARAALGFLNPNCDRDTWVKYGMCVKNEFGEAGFDIWDEWSSDGEGYKASDARSVWRSIKADGGVGFGSLIYDAKEKGWKDDSERKKPTKAEIDARKAAAAERNAKAAAEEAEVHASTALRAQVLWDASEPAVSHPYLTRKGVQSHGLRVGKWTRIDADTGEVLTVTTEGLLIPIRDRTRKIWSLQCIQPLEGRKKLYMKDGAKRGHFFPLGSKPLQHEGQPVFLLGEGYATCASAHEASGHMVLVCFDASNLLPVAKQLRERMPDAVIMLLADNDTQTEGNPGVTLARAAANEVGGLVAVPPPGDFNDLHVSQGLDAVAAEIGVAFLTPGAESDQPVIAGFDSSWTHIDWEKNASEQDHTSLEPSAQIYDKSSSLALESGFVAPLLETQPPTQDSVALVFRAHFEGRLLYAHNFGCWLKWDGTRWHREETMLAFDFVRHLARQLNLDGKSGPSSSNFCKGVETFVRADRSFAVEGGEFDVENYLLNTPAGTYDLRTNKMRPHDPLDRIMKSTSVAPSAEGGSLFKKFINEITGGDESMERFLQVALGACLSGAIESHWMMFWTGTGRNGKNTLGDLVMEVMGDYAKKVPSSTLMSKQHEDHPTEIANLQGARLVVSSEVEDGAHWNESRINELTGDQVLSARFMRGNFFHFKRTHKHLIFGNHRPQLRNATDALKARIKIVPFKQSFIGREDADLPTKLRDEAGFVLSWLMEGHTVWMTAGRKLPACEAIETESHDYFEAQSTVEAWVRERVARVEVDERGHRSWPKASDLYKDYRSWKDSRGELPVSQSRWGESMAKLFTKKTSDGVRYLGALLLPI